MSAAQELANAKGGNELLDSLSAASKDGGDSASAIYVKALANGVTLGVEATGKVFGERVLPALSSGLDEVAKSADVGSSMSKLSSQTQGLLSSAQTALGKVAKDTEQLKAQAEELKGQADVVRAAGDAISPRSPAPTPSVCSSPLSSAVHCFGRPTRRALTSIA